MQEHNSLIVSAPPASTVEVFHTSFILEHPISIYGDAENPLFLAKDVAEWIEHSDTSTMLRNVDDDEKVTNIVCTPGGKQKAWFLTEQGIYEVLMQSRKPIAKQFKKQVKEILSIIRKQGGYIASTAEDTDESIMARALIIAQQTIERNKQRLALAEKEIAEKDEQLAIAVPKAAFVDHFCVSAGTILVRDYAKHIAQALDLTGFGERVMFDWLKNEGYLNQNRYPSQRSTAMGLFRVYEGIHQHHDGSSGRHHTSRITCKGQTYFYEKLKNQYESQGRWW